MAKRELYHLSRGRQEAENPQDQLDRLSLPEPNSGCWIWLGKIGVNGYADMSYRVGPQKRVTRRAFKVAWEIANATECPQYEAPYFWEIDHLCHQRWCVNPDHLELVTHQVNIQRRKPFDNRRYGGLCKNGHVLPPKEQRSTNGSCKICTQIRTREWRKKNRAKLREYERRRR